MRCSSTQKSAGPAGQRALREARAAPRHLHTGLEDPERTQPTDPRGVIEEALTKNADITAVQLKISILERLETSLGEIELRGCWLPGETKTRQRTAGWTNGADRLRATKKR
eukprot:COSAG06_NODE_5043_length_3765_cov_7.691489_4_plen_111_part_00